MKYIGEDDFFRGRDCWVIGEKRGRLIVRFEDLDGDWLVNREVIGKC